MERNDTVVFSEPGLVTIENHPKPEPTAGEVLVKTSRSLISTGTELTLLQDDVRPGSVWDKISNFPVVGPGYCNVGEIVEVGPGVDSEYLGTRVGVWEPHQKFNVVDVNDCFPIPEAVDDAEATFFGIAMIVMNGVRIGDLDWGETACVYGLGLLGQLTVRIAWIAGAEYVFGLDLSDDRLGHLPDTIEGINPKDRDPSAVVTDRTDGRNADVVFEVTGNPEAIPDQFSALRDQGRLVILSSPDGATNFDFHDYCNRGSYQILGAHVYAHPDNPTIRDPWSKARHGELFFEYLLDGRLDLEGLITHQDHYSEAPSHYQMLADSREQALGVVLEWE